MDAEAADRERRRRRRLNKLEWRRRVWSFFIGCSILFGAFAAFFVLQQENVQREYIYPYYYREMVEDYSQRYHVDPYLVAGVIKAESKFQTHAQSSRGATGLMQLMPATATWIAGQLEDNQFSLDKLKDPAQNIWYGTWYLGTLQEEFQGNEVLMLAAYNAGRGNVLDWMELYGWDYSFHDISAIPFRETEEYVRSVLRNREKYKLLYGAEK